MRKQYIPTCSFTFVTLYVFICLFYVLCCVYMFFMSGLRPRITFFGFPLESWSPWLLLRKIVKEPFVQIGRTWCQPPKENLISFLHEILTILHPTPTNHPTPKKFTRTWILFTPPILKHDCKSTYSICVLNFVVLTCQKFPEWSCHFLSQIYLQEIRIWHPLVRLILEPVSWRHRLLPPAAHDRSCQSW